MTARVLDELRALTDQSVLVVRKRIAIQVALPEGLVILKTNSVDS